MCPYLCHHLIKNIYRVRKTRLLPEAIAAADGDDGNIDVEQQGRIGPDAI